MKESATYWVYILLCENGGLYTGYTCDLKKRFEQHQKGTGGCKYTKAFRPVSIAQSWELKNKSAAMKIECLIKKLSKSEKEKLIEEPKIFTLKFSDLL